MPTYQYSCTDCGHFLEIFQSFSDDSLTVCPVCEGRLRKVFNAVGVVFKGSGFYRNDSRSATNGGGKGTENGGGSAGSTADAGSNGGASGTPSGGGETGSTSPQKSEGSGSSSTTPSKGSGSSSGRASTASTGGSSRS